MGEVAEGLLDGEFDYVTGEYIGDGVGYPRTMYDNKYVHRKKKKNNPINNYTHDNRVVWEYMMQIDKSLSNFNLSSTKMSAYTKEYGKHKNFTSIKTSDICSLIRETKESWNEFKKWFKTKI